MHTMDYDSDLQRKKILTHATMCMNLEDIILSKTRQLLKKKKQNSMISFI